MPVPIPATWGPVLQFLHTKVMPFIGVFFVMICIYLVCCARARQGDRSLDLMDMLKWAFLSALLGLGFVVLGLHTFFVLAAIGLWQIGVSFVWAVRFFLRHRRREVEHG